VIQATGDTSDDAFLGGGLQILQPKAGYRAGIDAVLLAAAAPTVAAALVLDVGAGVGVVGLAVARRLADAHVVLVERDCALAELARANIARNGLGDRVRAIEADVSRPLGELRELAPQAERFDLVLANPPYHALGRGTAARESMKAAAHAMPAGDLDRWARFLAAMARPGGSVTVIHRADALGDILAALTGRFGGVVVFPLYPREGEPASRVLIQATKGSRAPLELRRGLVLHDADNRFRPEVDAILRRGAALSLTGAAPN
jgi:FkbM family methyltransferase